MGVLVPRRFHSHRYKHTHTYEWRHNKGSNVIIRYVRTGNPASLTCTFFGGRGFTWRTAGCPGAAGGGIAAAADCQISSCACWRNLEAGMLTATSARRLKTLTLLRVSGKNLRGMRRTYCDASSCIDYFPCSVILNDFELLFF